MHLELDQHIDSPPAAVAAALADPEYYATLGELPDLGTPEVVAHHADGNVVTLDVRYRFTRVLSAAVAAVIDPKKLTWVDHATHDLGARTVTFELRPDNYPDRFTASGGYRVEPDGEGAVRRLRGDLKVRAPLVAGRVEKAIAEGLHDHFAAEAGHIARFLAHRPA